MKKTLISIITASTLVVGSTSFASGEFSDVNPDDWYYDSVTNAAALGIINGNGDGTFAPDDRLTVAEAITIAARINASYFKSDAQSSADSSSHWADSFFSYAINNGIIPPDSFSPDDYDRAIKRGEMFDVFASVLPDDEYTPVNSVLMIPEPSESEAVEKLFCSGIVIGSDAGFETDQDITRAEAAAICVRISNKDQRVKLDAPATEAPSDPAEPDITEPEAPESENDDNPNTEGSIDQSEFEVVEPKIYSIPLTFWDDGDFVTGAPKITTGESNGIKTRFGNHTYGTESQSQYNYVMDALDEAFKYCAGGESKSVKNPDSAYNLYKAGRITQETLEKRFKKALREDRAMSVLFDETLAIKDDTIYSNFYRAYQTGREMSDYIKKEYVEYNKKSDSGSYPGTKENLFRHIAKGSSLNYEGLANFQMAIYDYLGFSTRMVETIEGKCQGVQILLCGEWICVELLSTDLCLLNITADKLKLYTESGGKNGSGEELYLKGIENKGAVNDLRVLVAPTHLPYNFDYDAK